MAGVAGHAVRCEDPVFGGLKEGGIADDDQASDDSHAPMDTGSVRFLFSVQDLWGRSSDSVVCADAG